MALKNTSEELDDLRGALSDLIRACNFPKEPSDCILKMINAGELDVAYETLVDNISEYEELRGSVELRERVASMRRRLDLLPPRFR